MLKKTWSAVVLIVAALCITSFADALERTPTGFYWPIGTSDIDQAKGWWLSKDPDYYQGKYHIGVDMMTRDLTHSVYSISSGKIIKKHCDDDSWGPGNCALFIQHVDSGGRLFVAVYGHLRTNFSKGDPVSSGENIGTTGPWAGGIHLHFGIHPGSEMPYSDTSSGIGWGIMRTSYWPDQNGFVDPVAFITTHAPGNSSVPYRMVSDIDAYGNIIALYWQPTNVSCKNADMWCYDPNGRMSSAGFCSKEHTNAICYTVYDKLRIIDYKYSLKDWIDTFFTDEDLSTVGNRCSYD